MRKMSKFRNVMFRTGTFLLMVGFALTPLPGSVGAQEEEPEEFLLRDIIITAQKREQSLQEVPISVTVLTGDTMETLGLGDFTEITQQVPNMQLNMWSPKFTIFNLRGISQNNFIDNLEAPIAVYVDDVYMASMNGISGQLFDLERVEVLRGPQGTLFGRNATGGLIHYVSRVASEKEINGYLEAEYGSFDRRVLEGALGGSLSDTVRFRVAGRWNEQDGYVESVDTIIPGTSEVLFPGSGQDIGGMDGYALRGTLQVDFSDQFQGNFWLKYSEDDDVPTGGYVFENCAMDAEGYCPVDEYGRAITLGGVIDLFGQPTSPHSNYNDYPGFMNREKFDVIARFDYEMENGMKLTSITDYNTMEYSYDEDGDALAIPSVTYQTYVPDYTQWSEELRLSGESDSMRWQTGFYYLDLEINGGSSVTGAPAWLNIVSNGRVVAAGGVDTANATVDFFNQFEGARSTQDYIVDSTNWSIFGQVDYDLSENLMLTAGLRWSEDDKNIDWRLFFTDNFNPTPILIDSGTGFAADNPGVDEIDYGDWTGRLALQYSISEAHMIFGSINRGIKGGNWSIENSPNITAQTFQHKEEVLWSYEVGFKSDFKTSRLNGTAYYYDYEDYQAFSPAGFGPFVQNTDARAFGGELEWYWVPTRNWDVALGLAFSDSKVDEVLGHVYTPIYDTEFPNAPPYSGNYLVRYHWDIRGGNLAVQIDGAFYDDQFLEVINGPGSVQEAYNVSNARVTYTTNNERFRISAWVKNFTDEEYKLYMLDIGILGATSFYAPPITYGVTGRFNW